MNTKSVGFWNVIASYLMWGILPIYWKALAQFPAMDIIVFRIVWSFVFLAVLMAWFNDWKEFFLGFSSLREIVLLLARAFCLFLNWFLYVWGINNGYIVDCSFGYFVLPLMVVLIGFVFLKEKLTAWEVTASLVALAGVLNLIIRYGHFPWLALTMSGSFAVYALLRKTSRQSSVTGLTSETAVLSIPALAYFYVYGSSSGWCFYKGISITDILLILCSGVITVVPLICYTFGIRRVKLSSVGILQYLNPTCTFLIGVFLYNEKFSGAYFVTFLLIWISIIIFTWGSLRKQLTREN